MKVLEKFKQKLRYKRYAERTIEVYTHYLEEFFKNAGVKDPYQVSLKMIIFYLENKNYKSASHQNQVIGGLKLFARYMLGKNKINLDKIERPRKRKKIQPIIPRDVILNKLKSINNLKHKSILTLGYACGLRVSEVLNLKWDHINRENKIIIIYNSKGAKDRIVPFNDTLIKLLELYWYEYKTKNYVFTGLDWRPQYSASSCNALVKKYIGKKYRFHTLRKSFANHLYDMGNDLAKIQDALGHKSIKTTRIYVQASPQAINQLTELV